MFNHFKNRREAGKCLAEALTDYKEKHNCLVLALPRGGVPVAYELAHTLSLPLDVLLVRKLGVPGHEELAMGAIALGDIRIINHDVLQQLFISPAAIEQVTVKEQKELHRRDQLYRKNRPAPQLEGKVIILVDDGLATGATMKAAIAALRKAKAISIIIAVPVGSPSACRDLEGFADKVFCLYRPEPFYGVGQWYVDFSQTSDGEVQALLENSKYQTTGESADI